MNPEHEAAAQGAFLIGTVALRELREKDAAIERLEREVELLQARLEELLPSVDENGTLVREG